LKTNLHFVEEVNGEVGKGVSQDRLLDQQDVAAGLLDLKQYGKVKIVGKSNL
jgi:hypothetical protein